MKTDTTLIVSRYGQDALRLKQEGAGWYRNGDTEVLHSAAMRHSDTEGVGLFTVQVFGTASQILRINNLGLPARDFQQLLNIVAECRIGDFLDDLTGPLPKGARPNLECSSEYISKLMSREGEPDEVVLTYLTAKTWWAYKYDQYYGAFMYPDQLRLGRSLREMRVIADGYIGERWTHHVEPQHDGFALTPTPSLKRLGPQLMARAVVGPIFNVLSSLAGPRYRPSSDAMRKAYAFLNENNPDYPNAAKEAVAAIESMARIITGASTLGKAVGELKRQNRVDSPTAKVLEAIYEYRNATPGVGHGGKTVPSTEIAEARLIVNLCASASLYLLELDT